MKTIVLNAAFSVALLASLPAIAQDAAGSGTRTDASEPSFFDRVWNTVTFSSSDSDSKKQKESDNSANRAGDPTPVSKDDTSDADSYRPDVGDPK